MKIYNPPISQTIEILDFIFICQKKKKDITVENIISFFRKTRSYMLRTINFLIDFNIISNDLGILKLNDNDYSLLENNELTIEILLKKKIVTIQPFIEYVSLLKEKQNKTKISELVKFLYNIEESASVIIKTFDSWIKFCEIDLEPFVYKIKFIEKLQESLTNRLLANLFLKEFFDENYRLISQQVIEDLLDAILLIKHRTLDALTDAGRALEDFLRIDLVGTSIDLSSCSGIGQISQRMNGRGFETIYPKKLNNIVSALGNIRSMGDAHGTDMNIGLRWSVSEEYTMNYILSVISVINSYITYREKRLLII